MQLRLWGLDIVVAGGKDFPEKSTKKSFLVAHDALRNFAGRSWIALWCDAAPVFSFYDYTFIFTTFISPLLLFDSFQ